MVLVAAFA